MKKNENNISDQEIYFFKKIFEFYEKIWRKEERQMFVNILNFNFEFLKENFKIVKFLLRKKLEATDKNKLIKKLIKCERKNTINWFKIKKILEFNDVNILYLFANIKLKKWNIILDNTNKSKLIVELIDWLKLIWKDNIPLDVLIKNYEKRRFQ